MTPVERSLQILPIATVDKTLACETDNCYRCRGTVYSLTSTHGRQCVHACHGADDRVTEAARHRDHGDVFEVSYGEE